MPLQQTSGAASYDAFGGGAPVAAKYIEDFFQSWLRTGTGSSTTVTTGLNASINKSLVWTKSRSAATNHKLTDNVRGATKALSSNTTGAEVTDSQGLTAFSSTGYTIGTNTDYNNSGATYVDFQWVATPKFFDVVTFTSSASGNKTFSHNLGAVPGCVIIKNTQTADPWIVYHRSVGDNAYLSLNSTAAQDPLTGAFSATSTTFTISSSLMYNSQTYVAYLFAHNAGGFGLTGTDNVISCGSFTDPASGNTTEVNLGYEPQWLLVKPNLATTDWYLVDNMRGMVRGTSTRILNPNLSAAESNGFANGYYQPTATGFTAGNTVTGGGGTTCIYIAIRRGPMKVPTTGTSVFSPNLQTGGGTVTTNFPVDLIISTTPSQSGSYRTVNDRLRGGSTTRAVDLYTNVTDAETTGTGYGFGFDNNTGYRDAYYSNSFSDIYWNFRRAPGFFDEVCYTGNGSTRTVNHNLGVVPELMIVKNRSAAAGWIVYSAALGATKGLQLNLTSAEFTQSSNWNNTSPTSSVFTVGTAGGVNSSGSTYVAYLFASCPGVSKVGSYTGTGTTQQINCGFTAGARFVLIKRTSESGDWYVWDSARGIVAGNDPYLLLNNTAAEVINTDFIDTASTGFEISSTAPAAINASGGSFIFLAIA